MRLIDFINMIVIITKDFNDYHVDKIVQKSSLEFLSNGSIKYKNFVYEKQTKKICIDCELCKDKDKNCKYKIDYIEYVFQFKNKNPDNLYEGYILIPIEVNIYLQIWYLI